MCISVVKGLFQVIMLCINFFVFVCGTAFIILGSWMLAKDEEKILEDVSNGDYNDNLVEGACIVLIITGVLLFVVGFLGCCGIITERSLLLTLYIIIVTALLLCEVTAAILMIVFREDLSQSLQANMYGTVTTDYGTDPEKTASWDRLQLKISCCGAYNYTDYKNSDWKKLQEKNNTLYEVPKSCCNGAEYSSSGQIELNTTVYGICNEEAKTTSNKTQVLQSLGCYDAWQNWIEDKSKIIIWTTFALVLLQVLGIIIACCIKQQRSESIN